MSSYGYLKDEFDQTCSTCGAVFHVTVPGQQGHEESEEYWCPECMEQYHTRASNSPRVELKSPRTDGKTTKAPSAQALFNSYNEEALAQGKRLASWLEKRAAAAAGTDQTLVLLKQAERDAHAAIDTSQPEGVVAEKIRAHEKSVVALIDHLSKRR